MLYLLLNSLVCANMKNANLYAEGCSFSEFVKSKYLMTRTTVALSDIEGHWPTYQYLVCVVFALI